MVTLALAAISARPLAEAAAREGLGAVALDLFGDQDTRRAASAWLPIGSASALHIDAQLLLDALASLARCGDVQGWVAGAGFDGRAELLAHGAARLPLIGTAAADQARVRDPATFFGFLKACGFAYPPVRHDHAGATAGWLHKDAAGCGGWHITRAEDTRDVPSGPLRYLQREARGVSMSATFVANGHGAVLLGFNQQIVRPLGDRPFVYGGVVGPVHVPQGVRRDVTSIVCSLVEGFSLRGLGSLDFLLDGERVLVLEVNPRPSASMALYPRLGDGGVLQAHVRACRHGVLPVPAPARIDVIEGQEIVFAPKTMSLGEPGVAHLARQSDTHDVPAGPLRLAAGEPVCSVSACGSSVESVKMALLLRREALLLTLEACE